MVAQLSKPKNVQMTAVCDLWTVNRERAVAANQKAYGTAPRALLVPEQLLELKDLDAVIDFYNERFKLGLNKQEHADLVAFLATFEGPGPEASLLTAPP